MDRNGAICLYTELKKLQVINLDNGKNYGYIKNVEFDLSLGKINAIIVRGKSSVIPFLHRDERRIPYHDIEKIGNDTILCRVREEK